MYMQGGSGISECVRCTRCLRKKWNKNN